MNELLLLKGLISKIKDVTLANEFSKWVDENILEISIDSFLNYREIEESDSDSELENLYEKNVALKIGMKILEDCADVKSERNQQGISVIYSILVIQQKPISITKWKES